MYNDIRGLINQRDEAVLQFNLLRAQFEGLVGFIQHEAECSGRVVSVSDANYILKTFDAARSKMGSLVDRMKEMDKLIADLDDEIQRQTGR